MPPSILLECGAGLPLIRSSQGLKHIAGAAERRRQRRVQVLSSVSGHLFQVELDKITLLAAGRGTIIVALSI